jgi:hypothetical protein
VVAPDLPRIAHGKGGPADLDLLVALSNGMAPAKTICALADAAAIPTLAAVKHFRSEFEECIRLGRTAPESKTAPELHVRTVKIQSTAASSRRPKQPLIRACHERRRRPDYCYHPGLGGRFLPHLPGRVAGRGQPATVARRTPVSRAWSSTHPKAHETRRSASVPAQEPSARLPDLHKAGECDLRTTVQQGWARAARRAAQADKRKSSATIVPDEER